MLVKPFIPVALIDGGLDGSNRVPSAIYPRVISMTANIKNFEPLFNRLRDPVYLNQLYSRTIRYLALLSTPSAVFRAIARVIIYPIKTVFSGRLSTHIGQEVSEPIFSKPSVAHFNTSAAISMIGPIPLVVTPSNHSSVGVTFQFIGTTPSVFIVPVVSSILHIGHYIGVSISNQLRRRDE